MLIRFLFLTITLLQAAYCFGVKPVSYLYAHGIAHTNEQAFWYLKRTPAGVENNHYLIDGKLFSFDFPDATNRFWQINFYNTSLGQANELSALYHAYSKTIKALMQDNQSTQLVFVGLSRGAATGLNFLGLFKTPHIKAAIFESPFDTHAHLIEGILKKIYLDAVPGMQTVGSWIMQAAFMQYKKNGICPLDVVDKIAKDLPVFLICSKEDSTVPYLSTIEIYKKLIESGHKHTYILVLEYGRHAQLLNGLQGQLYQNTIHAFYKKYNLPHNAIFADLGQKSLECCQPTLDDLTKL